MPARYIAFIIVVKGVGLKRAAGKSHCPINFGLETFGDAWSLLVIRDIVYFGKHTFSEFLAAEERIAPSILANRLAHLEQRNILTRTRDHSDRRKASYRLTETGLALIPILLEIAAWSARTDPDTDAPQEWIALVDSDKERITRLVIETVRDGGCVFVGENSVLARLAG
jgi:DNA-binding HxlR family transcriptional regulator